MKNFKELINELEEKKTMKDLAGSALIIGGIIMLNGVNSSNSGSL